MARPTMVAMTSPVSSGGFVAGFNPVPMAGQVARLGSLLRTRALWTLGGVVVWTVLWWTRRDSLGNPLWLLLGYGVGLLVVLVLLLRDRKSVV